MRTHSFIQRVVLIAALAPVPLHAGTLYADLGERPGVTRLIDAAMARFLADGRISSNWEDVNIDRSKRFLVEQFCAISGGGCPYTGRDMRAAHKAMHLTRRDFNALTEDLQDAMDELDIPFTTQSRLVALLAPMQRDVVTR